MSQTYRPKKGGSRSGAGRKPSGRKTFCLRYLPSTHAKMKDAAVLLQKKTVGQYLDALHGQPPVETEIKTHD